MVKKPALSASPLVCLEAFQQVSIAFGRPNSSASVPEFPLRIIPALLICFGRESYRNCGD